MIIALSQPMIIEINLSVKMIASFSIRYEAVDNYDLEKLILNHQGFLIICEGKD